MSHPEYYRHNHSNDIYYGELSGSQYEFITRAIKLPAVLQWLYSYSGGFRGV